MRFLKGLAIVGVCGGFFACGHVRAEIMPDFVARAFDWHTPDERPHLMLSRGTVMAWLEDPSTFLPVDNARGFYTKGDRALVIVPPGTALIAFPPRHNRGWFEEGGRLHDPRYQLAVTQDGLWGVIDTSKRSLFLDESDLTKMSLDEPSDEDKFPKFGMLKVTAYTVVPSSQSQPGILGEAALKNRDNSRHPIAIGLTRGEIFRVIEDDGQNSTIEAYSVTSKSKSAFSSKLHIPDEKMTEFRINGDIVPYEEGQSWRNGAANYRSIFEETFANVRIPQSAELRLGCDEVTSLTRRDSSNREVKTDVSLEVGGNLWAWVESPFRIGFSTGQPA